LAILGDSSGFNDVDTEKCFGQFALCDFGELLTMLWSII
jgi:hypothetical protein